MKRAAGILLAGALFFNTITASAVDWTAILNERKAMINESSFELYYEGSVDSAPYYGAKYEPRGGTYFGCVTENEGDFDTPSGAYLTFLSGADRQTDMYYPANSMIKNGTALGVIEYTAYNFEDFDINSFAQAMANLNSAGVPMIVSIMNEMNTNNMQYDSARYVTLFRQAADIVHRYPNLAVAWTPIALGSLDKSFEEFYPGDQYVDWLGLSMFDIHKFMGNVNTTDTEASYFMTGNYSWATNRIKPFMQFVQRNNIQKPIAIIQGGVANQTLASGNIDSWAIPRLRNMYYDLIMKYPQIKMINYFNVKLAAAEAESFHFVGKPYLADIVDEAASCGAYITAYGTQPKFVFRNASLAGSDQAENGYVPVYVQAYIPGSETNMVHFKIDGTWYHCTDKAPYKCLMNVTALADGAHTVTAECGGYSRTASFYKSGSTITFGI